MKRRAARLRRHHRDGWEAYGRYLDAIEDLWANASAKGITWEAFRATGGEPVVDPGAFAPDNLGEQERVLWCLGWSEHQAIRAAIARRRPSPLHRTPR